MSDIGPYAAHQHAAVGAVKAHTLVGEPIDHLTTNQSVGTPATFSTAPFIEGPKVAPRRVLTPHERDRMNRCVGKNGSCKARPMHGTDLCVFHTKQKERRESAATS